MFPLMLFSFSNIPINILNGIQSSRLLSLFWSVTVSETFLVFHVMKKLRGALGRHFIGCPSVQACMIFSNDSDWCYAFWEEHTKIKCLSHSITSSSVWHSLNIINDVNLDHFVHVVSTRSLYCMAEIFSFQTLILGSRILHPPLKKGRTKFHLSERGISTYIFLFINHLFISVWTHVYLLYTFNYNLMPHYFVHVFSALAIGSSFRLASVSLWHEPFVVCLFVFARFL